ncbi:MAG TPA: ferrous iron transport protein A [Ruminococcaceae bacterium]|nr:ferrous iron transport protein A [Oscillospiraceae bacterium]
MDYVSLYDIKPGERAAVQQLLTTGPMRRRLLDLGLVPGTRIECVGQSPSGDPKAYLIRGAAIALRSEDARNILIRQEVV